MDLCRGGIRNQPTTLSKQNSDFQRLQDKVIKVVDVSYGGENGFNQAIELAEECLAKLKFIQEEKLIGELSSISVN